MTDNPLARPHLAELTLEEYKASLPNLDWYYQMSDDHNVYLRGLATIEEYQSHAKNQGSECGAAFEETRAKFTITP